MSGYYDDSQAGMQDMNMNMSPQMNQSVQQMRQPQMPMMGASTPAITQVRPITTGSYRYDVGPWAVDFSEILRRAFKYLLEGLAVALVAYFILKDRFTVKEAVILGVTAALTFALLDTFSPTVAFATRFGAGFGLGTSLFGVPMAPLVV